VTGKASVEVTPGAAATVTVLPSSITIAPGGSSTFSAVVKDAAGNPLAEPVSWTVSPSTAGTVDGSGKFTAGTLVGTYPDAIAATAGPAVGRATVTIKSGALHHLPITPASRELKPTAAAAFSVEGREESDHVIAVTPSWAVTAGGGTINNQGIFVAGTTAGTFNDTVQATASGLSVTATVVVEPGPLVTLSILPAHATLRAGAKQQFTAKGSDAWGNAVPTTELTWSADPAAGTISSDGAFTAGQDDGDWPNGVSATAGSVSASAGVRIEDGEAPAAPHADSGCSVSASPTPRTGAGSLVALLLGVALLGYRRRGTR